MSLCDFLFMQFTQFLMTQEDSKLLESRKGNGLLVTEISLNRDLKSSIEYIQIYINLLQKIKIALINLSIKIIQ